MSDIWILLADGARAKVYEYSGPNSEPRLVDGGDMSHLNVPSQDLVTDKRGRVFHSADGTRSAMERSSDPHEQEKINFSIELRDFLDDRYNDFTRLIVVAPPKMLGYLRDAISTKVQEKVAGEIDKDIVRVKPSDLGVHLQHVLNINPRLTG